MSEIYCEPENYGLEIFEHIQDDHASYSFNDLIIWRRKEDGKLLYQTDSGCSCPMPFENIGIDDLIVINSIEQLDRAIEEYRGDSSGEQCCTLDRKKEVLNKVKEYLVKS